mgnify:CR=1 FL=1
MKYFEFTFHTSPCTETVNDVLAAVLGEAGFESFVESEGGLTAYIQQALCDENTIKNAITEFPLPDTEITYTYVEAEDKDWNEEWEKNYFKPIRIGNDCIIRASFHEPEPGYTYNIIIDPKMAFGTGNHETTSTCVLLMQKLDFTDKIVLDMGCGSGILGITAAKLGAKEVTLSDIDPQAIEASAANIKLNKVEAKCKTVCGDLDTGSVKADIVIANITADVLIRLKEQLGDVLKPGGYAVISGIINARVNEVMAAYSDGFELLDSVNRGEWNAMLLKKNGGEV